MSSVSSPNISRFLASRWKCETLGKKSDPFSSDRLPWTEMLGMKNTHWELRGRSYLIHNRLMCSCSCCLLSRCWSAYENSTQGKDHWTLNLPSPALKSYQKVYLLIPEDTWTKCQKIPEPKFKPEKANRKYYSNNRTRDWKGYAHGWWPRRLFLASKIGQKETEQRKMSTCWVLTVA